MAAVSVNRVSPAAAAAGLAGSSGVILAALGAHVISDPRLSIAADFLLFHAAAALAACGLALAFRYCGAWFLAAAWAFLGGAVLFAGGLSAPALTGKSWLPMAAPLGGLILIAAWLWVALAALMAARATSAMRQQGQSDS
ncbi:MAG TPA: DUF423 domain-containing protein [Methylocella sp.]|nr:DUF423 domain-containing protein [Methylocella sp.]